MVRLAVARRSFLCDGHGGKCGDVGASAMTAPRHTRVGICTVGPDWLSFFVGSELSCRSLAVAKVSWEDLRIDRPSGSTVGFYRSSCNTGILAGGVVNKSRLVFEHTAAGGRDQRCTA